MLAAHPTIAAALISMFRCRFDPVRRQSSEAEAAAIEAELRTDIDAVTSLDEDRILRSILNLIHATVRTNFFQATGDGPKPTVSFKLDPGPGRESAAAATNVRGVRVLAPG